MQLIQFKSPPPLPYSVHLSATNLLASREQLDSGEALDAILLRQALECNAKQGKGECLHAAPLLCGETHPTNQPTFSSSQFTAPKDTYPFILAAAFSQSGAKR